MIKLEKLGNLCTFENGDRGKNYPKDSEFVSEGIPFVSGTAIDKGHLLFEEMRFITEDKYNSLRAGKACKGDILYSLRGSLGKCAISNYDKLAIASALVIIRPNFKINKDYLYYILLSDYFNKQVKNYDNGSVQANLSVEVLKDLLVPLPSISKQEEIAGLLKSIDSKIENNNKINFELESMARTLYDYWFLQFEFPNEEGKPYKSSGGKMMWNEKLKKDIPEGWEVKKLDDCCEIVLGGTPKTEIAEYWNGDINWLNSGEVANFPVVGSELKITQKGLDNSATTFMNKGSVVVSITGNLRTSILAVDSCANQSVVGILENNKYKLSYIYPFLKDMISVFLKVSTGNCQQHINKGTIQNTNLLVPPDSILKAYYDKVEKNYFMIFNCAFQNQELSSLRDFLLPLLMNGQALIK